MTTYSGPRNPRYIDGRRTHPLGNRWKQMIDRCTNPGNPAWEHYGGRGITWARARPVT